MELQIGATVAGYEILRLLGKGGMGEVYEVRHTISRRKEALKVIIPDTRRSALVLQDRFLREIQTLASLDHPNIAAFRTALQIDGAILMVMELLEGISLQRGLEGGAMSIEASVEVICQVLSALSYAHERSVIHRDVKPANIMLLPDGAARLMDFGIARAGDRSLTRSGETVGSVHYMSPEQVKGGALDGRSDVYSTGVVLYECLTGKRPIDSHSDYGLMRAHLEDIPVPPTELNPALPESLSSAVLKSLAKSPGDRFQSAAEFETFLRLMLRPSAPNVPAPAELKLEFNCFHPGDLAEIESWMIPAIGPIAKPLVKQSALRSRTLPELYEGLAQKLPPGEQPAFRAKCEVRFRKSQRPAQERTPDRVRFSPETLQQLTRELTKYLGPVASIVVAKEARNACHIEDLHSRLAKELPLDAEKLQFLAAVRRP